MYQSIFTSITLSFLDALEEVVEINVSISETVLMLIFSFIAGFLISVTYMHTSENGNYTKNFAITMILLPAIISSIVLLIGSNIARAFSLAGAFAIIRFRSDPAEPKDITYVLFSMAAGLALGIGEYVFAIVFTLILCITMIIISKTNFASKKKVFQSLKITIPEELNYEDEFKEIFEKYHVEYHLLQVKTTSLGSLYKLNYDVIFLNETDTKTFIDELRVKNANLDISLSMKNE